MITFQQLKKVHKASINKNNATEGFFNVFIFRKISIAVSFFLATFRVHPNVISFIAFMFNIVAGIVLMIDFKQYFLYTTLFIFLGYVLDMSDGEVARLNNLGSKFGAFLDPFLDRVVDVILPLTMGLAVILNGYKYPVYMYGLIVSYIGIRAALLYLEKISIELQLEQGIEFVRKGTKILPTFFRNYIKWDGGFTVIIYVSAVYFARIDILFLFLNIFFGLLLAISFLKIKKKLLK